MDAQYPPRFNKTITERLECVSLSSCSIEGLNVGLQSVAVSRQDRPQPGEFTLRSVAHTQFAAHAHFHWLRLVLCARTPYMNEQLLCCSTSAS